MMANWGCIMFLVAVVPLTKLAEQNMRLTVLVVSGCVALGMELNVSFSLKKPVIWSTCAMLNRIRHHYQSSTTLCIRT